MTHEEKFKKAKEAIEEVFQDNSVEQHKTAESLRTLIDEIYILLDTLEEEV